MKILVVTPYYVPDLGPSAPMFALLCECLAARGNEVMVLAAVPHFPTGQVSPEYRRGLWQWNDQKGVRVCRVRVPNGNRANLLHRLWTFLVYQLLATLAGLRLQYDVALISNPAIETGLPFAVLSWLRRKPSIFGVWDLYPEVGQQLGIFRGSVTVKIVKALEDFCLRNATAVQALSDDFVENLVGRLGIPSKLKVIPIWIDTQFIRPLPRNNHFSEVHGLNDVFVVLYAGNLGLSQGLELVLLSAQRLSSHPHIRFVLVGDGPSREALIQHAEQMTLMNIQFLPYQPRECLPELLATADVSLVSLQPGIGHSSIPSKTFSILASGRAVLVSADPDSAIVRLVSEAKAGQCVKPGNPNALSDAILSLSQNPQLRKEFGLNGRQYVESHHSHSIAASQFENLFQRISIPKWRD